MVAGLGNPGPAYERTRHNAGFMALDALAARLGVTHWKTKDNAAQAHVAAGGVVLVKPLSYMNESGDPLARIAAWWKTPPDQILVLVDDLDLPLGRLRMRARGSSGGQNGLKSIIARFGEDFPRLRIGIGRGPGDAVGYVLSAFSGDDAKRFEEATSAAAEGASVWLKEGIEPAMRWTNAWRPLQERTPADPQR